jgi:hypothetical protein
MVNKGTLLSLLVLSLCVVGGELASPSTLGVSWDPSSPITWGDFQGEPTSDAQWTAAAAIHMAIHWYTSFTIVYDFETGHWRGAIDSETLEIRNLMDPARSWVVLSKETPEMLIHEQRHFDLNEVYCRKLRAVLLSLAVRGGSVEAVREALQTAIDETADRILDALEGVQDRYDRETAHGNDPTGQGKWDDLISRWLDDPTLAPSSF